MSDMSGIGAIGNQVRRSDDRSDDSTTAGNSTATSVCGDNDNSNDEVEASNKKNSPPPPNGRYGWVCTACVAVINGHTWGLNSSYGVFLAYYLANQVFPGATSLHYAFIGSLSIGCALLVSPLATMSVGKFGTKYTLLMGAVLESASLVAASFASEIWHLFLTQGVLFGLGMGFLFVPSIGIVPQWFTTRRSLANGISTSGSGLGGVLYSFATGAMIRNLGLAWAFRILGILAFVVNVICAILIKDRNKAIGSTQSAFKVSLYRRPEYILLLGFGVFSMLGYVVLIFSLANYANEIGLDSAQAALVSAMFNLGQAWGRPCIGFFSDKTGRINIACFTSFLAGLFSFAIWINARSYGLLVFFAIIGGAVAGTFWATIAPVTAEVVGLKEVPSALSVLWMTILIPAVCSEPIALEIFQGTGTYLGTQLWVGFMFIMAALCLLILRGWKIGELNEIATLTHRNRQTLDPVLVEEDETLSIKSKKVGRSRMLYDCWKKGRV